MNDAPEKASRPVAVVAGGTAGIGLAIASHLDRDGYQVVVVGSRGVEEGASVVAAFDSGTYIQADLSEASAPGRAMAQVEQELGRADILVYAAARPPASPMPTSRRQRTTCGRRS